ncbi:MAG: PQQ-binding-like beta-propeller repeat protein [Planctomycetaceae bacterium]
MHSQRCASILFNLLAAPAVAVLLVPASADAGNWPQFRGPTGQGHSDEPNLPVEWGPEKNIAWKVEVPGEGWSSPIYWENRIYLTAAVPTDSDQPRDRQLTTLCLDAVDGKTIWSTVVFEQLLADTQKIHGKNSHASPTPLTDGRHLFVHFGTQGTACLTLGGDVVWKNRELRYRPTHGSGNSPILLGDLLFINCDGSDVQFVATLDTKTGKIRWKTERPPLAGRKGFSFGTPLAIEVDGRTQIVSPAAEYVVAYDPADGSEIWRFDHEGYSLIAKPVFGHGLIYFSTGYDEATFCALRPGAAPEIAWSTDKAAPHTPSPVLVGDEIYFVSDRGVGTCADARTGEVHWVERLGSNYSASPVHAGGLIYFQNEDGGTIVVRPGKTFDEVARNSLPGRTLASYAIADASIFLRTDTHLYRIRRQ